MKGLKTKHKYICFFVSYVSTVENHLLLFTRPQINFDFSFYF